MPAAIDRRRPPLSTADRATWHHQSGPSGEWKTAGRVGFTEELVRRAWELERRRWEPRGWWLDQSGPLDRVTIQR
ncbi:hypothetical protein V6N12_030709 [Hibiscus sabdariffa]|uniref:Uncharacterized protein n=1 Tax=Hibiscus sabdariffa TaxID=183260 RepID=A0ABR2E8S1_9ROSI